MQEAEAQLEETRAQLIDLGEQRAQYEHAIAVLIGEPATGFHIAEQPLAGDSALRAHRRAVRTAAAQAGHRGRGAKSRSSQRADRRRQGRVLPQHHAGCRRRAWRAT